MLKQSRSPDLRGALKGRRNERIGSDYDPATLGDPVALQAEWGPARIVGDSNVRVLVSVNPRRMEFGVRSRIRTQYKAVILAALGFTAVSVTALVSVVPTGGNAAVAAQGGIIVGLMLAGYCAVRLRIVTSPIVFDAHRADHGNGDDHR